ncbi:MAG: NnrU family protein [Rhizobiales bacterium PAR1]|nr:MAG: NnrU family protein [Rhizobiales bacterium PAR1]
MSKLIPLVLGLVVFIGCHIVTRMQGVRASLIARLGAATYRAIYSVVAIAGLALIVYGFGSYRAAGMIPVWDTPRWMPHLVIPLMWVSFILLAAAYLPGKIRTKAKHPMLLAVKIWAFTHLLANGDLGSILLFGSFLGWAVYARIALKRAGTVEGVPGAQIIAGSSRNDAIAILVGSVATALMVVWLHKLLIGVAIIGV